MQYRKRFYNNRLRAKFMTIIRKQTASNINVLFNLSTATMSKSHTNAQIIAQLKPESHAHITNIVSQAADNNES